MKNNLNVPQGTLPQPGYKAASQPIGTNNLPPSEIVPIHTNGGTTPVQETTPTGTFIQQSLPQTDPTN